ncbi:MAG: iron-containing alcohol dehydrogenase [Oscillospiraceae bacterium]|nr:iron-containing alcohol dehydrogenase [Oscillospiraceae bacterium]
MITSYECFVPPIMGFGSSKRIGITLRAKGYKKAFVIYDKGMKDFGIADPIIENLDMANIEAVCFDGVLPDPPDEMVEAAAGIARNSGCDVIVAIGGGSSMDTAKGVNVLINNPPPIKQYFGVQKNLRPGLPMVFVPTTSGTGSETTNMCVISCVSEGKKDSVVSPVCVGTLAFLDPELTMGLPPKPTAMTGIDAFAHAVESITGAQANPLSDALARDAIRTINKWLPRAVDNGKDQVAREKMMEASFFAGMAFTNALVHLGHSIGHSIGATFHVPHGLACAFCLPEVIEYTARTESEKVVMICEAMGVTVPENATWQEIGALAKDTIRAFIKRIGLPNMEESGIPLEALLKIAPMVTADTGFALIPYRITAARVAEMFRSAYSA